LRPSEAEPLQVHLARDGTVSALDRDASPDAGLLEEHPPVRRRQPSPTAHGRALRYFSVLPSGPTGPLGATPQGIPESERRPAHYTNHYTNAARSRPQASTHNREQGILHSLCLCGFRPSGRAQQRAARNKWCGIPLNGESRVRIPPPPPLSTPAAPACQHGTSGLAALAFSSQLLPFRPRCAAHGNQFLRRLDSTLVDWIRNDLLMADSRRPQGGGVLTSGGEVRLC